MPEFASRTQQTERPERSTRRADAHPLL